MWKCKYCLKEFEFNRSTEKANHSRWCARNPKKYKKSKICPTCNNNFFGRNKYCSDKCVIKTHSEKTKRIISLKRKEFLSKNPEKHPWRKKDKFVSIPCELVKDFLLKNEINFVEEFNPLDNRGFSIDIAFPDIKVGIEINGNQHYNKDGELNKYYKERHELIEKAGWKLFELHYSIAFNLDNLYDIIEFRKNVDYSNIIKEAKLIKKSKELEKSKIKNEKSKRKETDINIIKENLLSSNINFKKHGWVKEAATIIGCTDQKVSVWMRKNMCDFYSTCFVRRSLVRIQYDAPIKGP